MRISSAALISMAAFTAACSKNPSPAATAPQPAPAAPAAATAARPATAAPTPATATTTTTTTTSTAPAPAAAAGAVDVSGTWAATLDVQGQTIVVNINLARGPNGYTGDAAPEGQPGAPLSALTITGNRMIMSFTAPEGEAVFSGDLSTDRRAMAGTLAYQGQTIPFTMTKR